MRSERDAHASVSKTQHAPAPASPTIMPEEVVQYDLGTLRMQWPLSCYGLNLTWESGNNMLRGDYSPEELRCEAYAQIRSAGNIESYKMNANRVFQEHTQQVAQVLNNPPKAVQMARIPLYQPANRPGLLNPMEQQPQLQDLLPLSHYASVSTEEARALALESFTLGAVPELPPMRR